MPEQPIWVYAIPNDGRLRWYRKDTPASNSQGPEEGSFNWHNMLDVFPAGGNRFFGVGLQGDLLWYQHNGFNEGIEDWDIRTLRPAGWQQFSKRFSGDNGIVYAIKPDGTLLWYRYNNF